MPAGVQLKAGKQRGVLAACLVGAGFSGKSTRLVNIERLNQLVTAEALSNVTVVTAEAADPNFQPVNSTPFLSSMPTTR